MNNEEIIEAIDNLLVQSSLNTIQTKVLTEMVLNIYIETMPPENSKLIITRFFDQVNDHNRKALDKLSSILTDSRIAFRSKMDNSHSLKEMKEYYLSLIDQRNEAP